MDESQEIARVKRQLRQTRILIGGMFAVVVTGGVILATGGTAVAGGDGKARFEEIDVQRINVLEADGKPRMVLANKAKSPGVIIDGQDLGNAGQRAGIAFYNGEGDEAGGLGTDSGVVDGTKQAHGMLAFDQHKQDQTLVLQYAQNGTARSVGLRVQDRPEAGMTEYVREWKRIEQMPPGPEKDAAIADLKKRYPSPQRVFIGKEPDKASAVTLADGKGIPRIVLRVGANGDPRIQFMDADGKVTRTIKG
ncbi:hypothetical protein [Nonomuraea longicatena]|uniref:Uncharacterized protein n=1 Tax=Nonomuraea longicatena TaxID=83682 RepID=A0ABP4AZH3_9ACTN